MNIPEPIEDIDARLIQKSYISVLPHKKKFRRSFYNTIMEIDPKTRDLFRETFLNFDSLPDSIEMMVKYANGSKITKDEIKAEGLKHKTYGVHPRQFKLIHTAAIDSFKEFMGDEFTPEMEKSWHRLIDYFSEIMELGWRRK